MKSGAYLRAEVEPYLLTSSRCTAAPRFGCTFGENVGELKAEPTPTSDDDAI